MLCNTVEHYRVKSEQYWMEGGRTAIYGSLNVRMISEAKFPDHVVRKFRVQNVSDLSLIAPSES